MPYLQNQPQCSTAEQAVIETWMLLEYADRGSLDQAITARRFVRKADQLLDMVCG